MTTLLLLLVLSRLTALAAQPPPPAITSVTSSNGQKRINWTPFPSAQQYKMFRADDLSQPFVEDGSGSVFGYDWTAPLTGEVGFHRLQVVPMDANELLTANVLNRLAYGPTPDELERVRSIGPQAYIQEQLAPESISEVLSIDVVNTNRGWQYVTATGNGSSSILYVYLTTVGEGYLDDVKLVAGSVAEAGANLIRNGDFEAALSTSDWTISSNHFGSDITTEQKHAGNASLHLVTSSAGTTRDSSIWQSITPALSTSQTYTLSYWFLPGSNILSSDLTVRLSGSGVVGTAGTLATRLVEGRAVADDLRAWHVLHAVQSRCQLLEVLLQFLDNHFVTQHNKSEEYFDRFYDVGTLRNQLATQLEFKELQRWRQALLNPDCTFHALLKISAESQAMIIYLDTVDSRGDGTYIANENYARELLELFTFGVDNGYDQNDIVEMSKAWTGWRLRLVDAANEFNPFAPQSTTYTPGTSSGFTNLVGVWAFNYRQDRHKNTAKTIFPAKTVPARFGAPWAGRDYQLFLPARSGTNSIQDGYAAIEHLANQPFSAEFISIKLCRLFVHDDFPNPTTRTDLPDYQYYDYTRLNELTPEAQLVHACMLAWENSNPKGKIRDVLSVIFNSELFRAHAGSRQKIKTPFEFTVSAVRALRAATTNGSFTADTDGYSLRSPMNRMGSMNLFDRAEPDGYPEGGAPWISAGTLAERLRFAQALLTAAGTGRPTDAGNSLANPVGLLKLKLPGTSWNNAGAVADYFLDLLFCGEGKANLDLYRKSALDFLDTADNGAPSPFSALVNTSATYDTRVRGMVAMLMTFQRFHEQ